MSFRLSEFFHKLSLSIDRKASQEFASFVNDKQIYQLCQAPTFRTNILDLVLTYDHNSVVAVHVGPPLGYTEKGKLHNSIEFDLIVNGPINKTFIKKKIMVYKNGNFNAINESFEAVNWASLLEAKTINQQYDEICSIYKQSVERYVPCFVPDSSGLTKSKTRSAFFNESIRLLSNRKKMLFGKMTFGSAQTKEELAPIYRQCCKEVKRERDKASHIYQARIAEQCKSNPKVLHGHIKNMCRASTSITALVEPTGEVVLDEIEMANCLNIRFYNNFSQPSSSCS